MSAKLPSKETAIQRCIDKEGGQYVISHNNERTLYYLYKDVDGKLLKIGKAKNPVDFDKIIWDV